MVKIKADSVKYCYMHILSAMRKIQIKRIGILACLLLAAHPAIVRASGETNFARALHYQFSGNSDAAVFEYRKGLEASPENVDARVRLGTLLLNEVGDVDGAISEYMTALTVDPDCSYCQNRLSEAMDRKKSTAQENISRGNDFYRSGQLNRSVASYRIATMADPDSAEAHNCLAWTLYRLGKLEEGLQEVTEALRLRVDEPEFVNTLACIQYDRGQVDNAMANWKKAIAKSKAPNPADLYGLAIACLAKGDKELAIKNFKEAVKTDPSYVSADYLRDKIGMSVHALASHEQLVSLAGEPGKD